MPDFFNFYSSHSENLAEKDNICFCLYEEYSFEDEIDDHLEA